MKSLFKQHSLFLMCWSSSDSKYSHLRLQALYQITSESLAVVFNEFWMKLFIRHSSFILESYPSLLPLRCYVPAYFFLGLPFLHVLFLLITFFQQPLATPGTSAWEDCSFPYRQHFSTSFRQIVLLDSSLLCSLSSNFISEG